jgi:hypothetical protein
VVVLADAISALFVVSQSFSMAVNTHEDLRIVARQTTRHALMDFTHFGEFEIHVNYCGYYLPLIQLLM